MCNNKSIILYYIIYLNIYQRNLSNFFKRGKIYKISAYK